MNKSNTGYQAKLKSAGIKILNDAKDYNSNKKIKENNIDNIKKNIKKKRDIKDKKYKMI